MRLIGLAVLLLSFAVPATPQSHSFVQDREKLTVDDIRIFEVVLDYTLKERTAAHAGSYIVVLNQTLHYCGQAEGKRTFGCLPSFPYVPALKNGVIEPFIKRIDPELEKSFRARNVRYGVIGPLKNKGTSKVVETDELNRIFGNGFWDDFYKAFPDSSGLVTFALPVYSSDRRQAVVYSDYEFAGFGGWDSVFELKLTRKGWIVTSEHVVGRS